MLFGDGMPTTGAMSRFGAEREDDDDDDEDGGARRGAGPGPRIGVGAPRRLLRGPRVKEVASLQPATLARP